MSSGGSDEGSKAPSQLWWEELLQRAAAAGKGDEHILPLGVAEREYDDDDYDEEEEQEEGQQRGPSLAAFSCLL